MEWFILLLLVPAILVPVVLLCGFAGCGFQAGSGYVLPTPPTVTATPRNVDHITVSWQNTDTHTALRYHFERFKGIVPERVDEVDASMTTVEDTGLEAGTAYVYQVSTITPYGTSDPSTDLAITFTTAFDASTGAPTIQNNPGAVNFTFVQRISAAQLLAGGSKVVITVRGAPTGNMTINNIFISRAAGSGNLYDSAADLTAVLTSALTLPDDQPVDLGPIAYILDRTQDLIIAFDLSTTATAGNSRFVRRTGVTLFFQQDVQEASSQSRAAGYGTAGTDPELFFVVTIGVA